jgi:four helix bundle protein
MERQRFCETIGRAGALKKLQIPTSKLQRIFKHQAPSIKKLRVGWMLKFEASLDVGAWTLGILSVKYPESKSEAWQLSETPVNGDSQRHAFDLEERTAQFGEAIIRFVKKIPHNAGNNRLIGQLVGCGTSVGANYCEANEGVSKKDFKNTIGRCVKEAKEAKFFLRMIAASEPNLADEARKLYREAKELHLIFASIYRK